MDRFFYTGIAMDIYGYDMDAVGYLRIDAVAMESATNA